jgi:hypothetical protein
MYILPLLLEQGVTDSAKSFGTDMLSFGNVVLSESFRIGIFSES